MDIASRRGECDTATRPSRAIAQFHQLIPGGLLRNAVRSCTMQLAVA